MKPGIDVGQRIARPVRLAGVQGARPALFNYFEGYPGAVVDLIRLDRVTGR